MWLRGLMKRAVRRRMCTEDLDLRTNKSKKHVLRKPIQQLSDFSQEDNGMTEI
jgi:hypothetical protein